MSDKRMINGKNVKQLLQQSIRSVAIDSINYKSNSLKSSLLISSINGAVISLVSDDTNKIDSSLNNLKMMSLLSKDKWSEDELNKANQSTKSCYEFNYNVSDKSYSTRIYTYELEELHACIAQIPDSDLLLLFIADNKYPYGLLVMKMKHLLPAFNDMINYRLG